MKKHEQIIIRTLADLKAHRFGINALCKHCRHRHELDTDALIATLGPHFVYRNGALDRMLRCTECNTKGQTSTQLHLMDSPGSPTRN
jgi:hypothetical protein